MSALIKRDERSVVVEPGDAVDDGLQVAIAGLAHGLIEGARDADDVSVEIDCEPGRLHFRFRSYKRDPR
jgi:hypothetical protein